MSDDFMDLSDIQPINKSAAIDLSDIKPISGQSGQGNKGIINDTLVGLGKGVMQIPGAITGLADIQPSLLGINRPFDRATDAIGNATGFKPSQWAKDADNAYSPAMQQARQNVNQVWDDPNTNALDVAKAYATNPRAIMGTVVESLPSMYAGGALGRTATGLNALAKTGTAAEVAKRAALAGNVGEGAIMAGQSMANIDESVDPQIAALAAAGTGFSGALIGNQSNRITNRIANRFGLDDIALADIDAIAAGGVSAGMGDVNQSLARRVIGGAIQEGPIEEGLQSIAETGLQNLAEDKPVTQGMGRNFVEGSLAGSLMGGGVNAVSSPLSKAAAKAPVIQTPTTDDIRGNNGERSGLQQEISASESISDEQKQPFRPSDTLATGEGGLDGYNIAIEPEENNPIYDATEKLRGNAGRVGINGEADNLEATAASNELTPQDLLNQRLAEQRKAQQPPSTKTTQPNTNNNVTTDIPNTGKPNATGLAASDAIRPADHRGATEYDNADGVSATGEAGNGNAGQLGDATDLFNEDWFAGAEKETAQRKASTDAIVSALTKHAESETVKSDEFANKKYKDNKNVVDFDDRYHPYSNSESMSIGAINESKRNNRVKQHRENARKTAELVQRLTNGDLTVEKLGDEIKRIESFANSEDARIPQGMTKDDYIAYVFSQSVLGDEYGTHGKNSVAQKVIDSVRGNAKPTLSTPSDEDAAPIKQDIKNEAISTQTPSAESDKATVKPTSEQIQIPNDRQSNPALASGAEPAAQVQKNTVQQNKGQLTPGADNANVATLSNQNQPFKTETSAKANVQENKTQQKTKTANGEATQSQNAMQRTNTSSRLLGGLGESIEGELKPTLSNQNKPFKTAKSAEVALKSKGYPNISEATHHVVPVEGGFGHAPKVAAGDNLASKGFTPSEINEINSKRDTIKDITGWARGRFGADRVRGVDFNQADSVQDSDVLTKKEPSSNIAKISNTDEGRVADNYSSNRLIVRDKSVEAHEVGKAILDEYGIHAISTPDKEGTVKLTFPSGLSSAGFASLTRALKVSGNDVIATSKDDQSVIYARPRQQANDQTQSPKASTVLPNRRANTGRDETPATGGDAESDVSGEGEERISEQTTPLTPLERSAPSAVTSEPSQPSLAKVTGEKQGDIPVMTEEEYLASNGASRQDIGDAALHMSSNRKSPNTHRRQVQAQAKKDHELIIRRGELRKEYADKVANGKIRPPTTREATIATANGHPDNDATQAARRLLERKGIDWKQDIKASKSQPTTGSTVADIKKLLPKRVNKLVDAGILNIVQTVEDLPKHLQERGIALESRIKPTKYTQAKIASLIDGFIKEIGSTSSLSKEQKGIYDVITDTKIRSEIRKSDLEHVKEFVNLSQGHERFGKTHILLDHFSGKKGYITANEILDLGKVVRDGKLDIAGQKHIYTLNSGGVRFKVVVSAKGNKESIITFYSNRKTTNGIAAGHNALLDTKSKATPLASAINIDFNSGEIKKSSNMSGVEALYDEKRDQLYLVSDMLNKNNLSSVLSHELLHRSESKDPLVKAAIDRFEAQLQRSFDRAAKGIGSAIELAAYKRVMAAETPVKDQASEFRAYMVSLWSQNPDSFTGLLKKTFADLVATIRAFLVRNGLDLGFIKSLTPADLTALSKYGAKVNGTGTGNGILKSFAGQNAKTADTYQLSSAQQRIEAGDNPETVRQETGWFKGVDGKWRFEIDDSDASWGDSFHDWALNGKRLHRLSDFIDHPKLFEAYPELGKIGVLITKDLGAEGNYSATDKLIHLNEGSFGKENMMSVLLHEIQHGIQRIEGFATGGSPSQFRDKDITDELRRPLDKKILGLMDANPEFGNLVRKKNRDFIKIKDTYGKDTPRGRALNWDDVPNDQTESYFELLDKLSEFPENQEYIDLEQDRRNILSRENTLTAHEQYKRLAGEVESRNTQARQELTAEQRKSTPPSATADIQDSDVIVLFNGKEMNHIPAPRNADKWQGNAYDYENYGGDKVGLSKDAKNKNRPKTERWYGDAYDYEAKGGDKTGVKYSRAVDSDVIKEAKRKAGLGPKKTLSQAITDIISLGLKANVQAIRQKWDEMKPQLEQGIFDKFIGIKRAEKEILGDVAHSVSGYISARLSTGSSSTMQALLLHGAPKWEGGIIQKKDGSKSFAELLQPVKDDLENFTAWMVGRRADRLFKEGKENNFSRDEIDALLKLEQDDYQGVADDIAAMNSSVLDLAQEAGLVDAEARKLFESADYIPFYRLIEGKKSGPSGKGGLTHQTSGIKMLKGGDNPMSDPLGNMMQNWAHLIDASMKNDALNKTLNNLEGSRFVEAIQRVELKAALIPKEQVKKLMLESGLPKEIVEAMPSDLTSGIAKMWAMQAPTDPDVVRVMRDGKSEYYKVNDAMLLTSLTAVNQIPFGGIFKPMRYMKHLLTGAVTADPTFMARNFIRDAMHSWTIAEEKGFKLGVDSIHGAIKSFNEEGGYVDMMFAGASFQGGYGNYSNPDAARESMDAALRRRGIKDVQGFKDSILDTPKKYWEMYRSVGDAIENASREAILENAKRAGAEKAKYLFEAKDLMDFSMQGSFTLIRAMSDMLPFFNARLVGLYRLAKAGQTKEARKMILAKGLSIAMFSLALLALNSDNDDYEALEPWDQDTYWHFFFGNQHFRIPKPFELGLIFGTVPERSARALIGKDSLKTYAERMGHGASDTLAFNPVPQLFKPFIELYSNKDMFTGRAIEGMADEGKLPSARYNEYTSETMRALSASLPEALGASPKRLEHLLHGYLGALGMYALGASDMMVRQLSGMPDQPAMRIDSLPVVKAFYQERPTLHTKYGTEFYDMLNEVNQIHKTINAYKKEGNIDKANELMTDNADKLSKRRQLEASGKQLSRLRAQVDVIYRSNLSATDKRDRINALMQRSNEVSRMAVERSHPYFN